MRKNWKILIDAFRTELELIYKNKKLEDMYCTVGKKAFAKCKKYKKSLEFKRLSEVVKNHQYHNIRTIEKSAAASNAFALDIKNNETNEKLVDFRFYQLEYAKQLDLWQDSYRIIDDVNTLMKSRKRVGIDVLHKYYQNIYQIFWNARLYLYHAAAYQSYYTCLKSNKPDGIELEETSSILILSVLSIPKNPTELSQSPDIFRKNCL